MAEFASKREALTNAENATTTTRRDHQLQQLLDLTIDKLQGNRNAALTAAVTPPNPLALPQQIMENTRLAKYK
eukprot:CAMPEP_0170079310 /NCGR_PEP_ID=MMETSP0019_2-20121128/15724_1 /TAXON_ID=98059 /ORGANISM="Dinobryon sp., Strain UTEXLB2267" /LENGTH=72 /DNA_ID=CAMNT_0010292705 /DNA_START=675 /DNA_END=890 /DNA_ORIENTATION=-